MEDPLLGAFLGQHRIVARVGQGGTGAVYKAHQPALDRHVAIKVLTAQFAGDADFSARFKREAQAVARLEHPNILPVYDFGVQDGVSFIVMPLMPGGTLRDRLTSHMPLPAATRICAHLAGALDYAHQRSVIHRDVKPNNVLMGEGDWPLLADFGIAKIIGASTGLTETGVGIGTPAYLSPEQGQGLEVDGRTDLYALAVMLFQMLAGRVPFEAETPLAVVLKHIQEPVPSLRALNPDVPAELDGVLRKALAKRPEDRFASCREFADAVAAAGSGHSSVPAEYRHRVGPAGQAGPADLAGERGADRPRAEAVPRRAEAGPEGGAAPAALGAVARVRERTRGPGLWPTRALGFITGARRWLVASGAVAAAAAVAAGVLVPRAWEPRPMSGLFNIAIAPFSEVDERGSARPWDQGAKVSESIFTRLQEEFDAIPEMKGIVEVRGQNVEPVAGRTGEARQEAARRIADRLRAQLLIYGVLERDGNQTIFSPGFYITGLAEAEELLGPNHLGSPVVLSGPSGGLSEVLLVSEASRARTEALSLFAIGLTYLAAGKPSRSVEYFERAGKVQGWEDREGKEVLHLFLGGAYRDRNADGDTDRAQAAFATAARLNPEYARAYLGLGNLYLAEFERSGQAHTGALDRALEEFQRAESARYRPGTAYVDAKIRLNLGNVYVVKAQLGQADLFPVAEREFRRVIEEYEAGNQGLQRVVAHAYFGLGIVQERWNRDLARAATYYRTSIALASDPALRQLAETQLRAVGGPAR